MRRATPGAGDARLLALVVVALAVACGDGSPASPSPSPPTTESSTARATSTPTPPNSTPPSYTPTPTATPIPAGQPGSEVWRAPLPDDRYAWPVVSDDGETVYVGSGRGYNDDPDPDPGELTAIDAATGALRWQFDTPWRAFWPADHDGRVFIGSRDGTVFAVDADGGTELWRYETGGVPVDVIANEDGVFAADGDPETYGPGGIDGPTGWAGRVWALDPATGALRWQFETGADIAYISASPGQVLVASYASRDGAQEGLWALDAVTGAVNWQVPANFVTSPPVVAGDLVIVPSAALYAYRVSDGAQVWGQEVPDGGGWYHPATDGERIFTASNTHDMAMFDAATGTPLWTADYCDCGFLASVDERQWALYNGFLSVAPVDVPPDQLQPADVWSVDVSFSGSRPVLLDDLVVIAGPGAVIAFRR